ncbi:MAG TPA: L,D-transpeptidase, partial [Candidatus Sulfomarinibacteraceae bacterium]|nr:L,D-transpeptidase [Candidatus Sulfomarinibacteraceae bacterium]
MKKLRLLLIGPILLLTLAFFADRAEAANCQRSVAGVYVCDARPEPATFSGPGFRSGGLMFNRTYSWLEDHAPLYTQPTADAEIAVEGTVGILYYTIEGVVADEAGNQWYKVADNEYARAETMHHYNGSRLTGVEVNRQPERPFGWLMQRAQPAPGPDQPPPEGSDWLPRYTFVEIYDVALGDDGWLWMDIGNGQWVKQTFLALVDVAPRPEEVGEDEYWVAVDLFEEIFAAYEGDRMVYAGLTASGLEGWETNEGLFTVYARHREWPMWGGDPGD